MARKSEKPQQKPERALVPLAVYLPRDVMEQIRRVSEEQTRRPGTLARRILEEWAEERMAVGAAK